ncbi:MAG: hypothetical protein IJD45_06640 [Clostridia bacterium]|nr:hypothetical protein [Clostridia bacterium]
MNNADIDKLLKQNGKNIDKKAIEHARQTGDASALLKNLNDSDKQKLNDILSDKQKLNEVLKSPQAQMLLKLFNGGKNG